MHQKGIIYRDLKLENIMLWCKGHIKITDFGLSRLGLNNSGLSSKSELGDTSNTYWCQELVYSFVGTPEYLSPEVVKGTGYTWSTDWWSLGAIMFEMLTGESPFHDRNVDKCLQKILHEDVSYKEIYSKKAQKLISRLLERDPEKRIGAQQGAIEIMQDPFFKGIDWEALNNYSVKPPFKPKCKCSRETWVKYFSQEFVEEEPEDSYVESNLTLMQKTENHFEAFTYGFDHGILQAHNEFRETINNQNKKMALSNGAIIEADSLDEQ